ncbi:MAG: hypothetical protein DHS20C17_12190 [Cyclobacteriaceae bacterium]|nr:MAG: hypothetical protein DHS20C17_12190 [Cyclobacteriaceae bacterium]
MLNQNTKVYKILTSVVLLGTCCTNLLFAQADGLLYGIVTLKSGQSYQGQIRWNNREAMWNDIFEGYKSERPYQNLLSAEESKKLQAEEGDFKFGFMELWEDRNPNQSFMFRCNFGNIVKLEASGSNRVSLYLKNGQWINLKAEGGNIDDPIVVVDKSLGRQQVKSAGIKTIEFREAPRDLKSAFGDPIYGQILTSKGSFEGYITWDDEERMGVDIISGKQNGKQLDIRFQDISSIKAERDGSLITLKTGRELFLNNHDDVDHGNHGITIRGLPYGSLEIDWDNFISATFTSPPATGFNYNSYTHPNLLKATVRTTSGAKITSQVVYDLDEIYDIEMLNGSNGRFLYLIPFSAISQIEPQNDKFSLVSIKSGEQFLLGDSADVDSRNNGLILKLPGNKARFIKWDQVKSIQFE